MRPDIVALLKSSRNAFIGGLIGIDLVATFRWAVLRAYCRAVVAFREAGKRHTEKKSGEFFFFIWFTGNAASRYEQLMSDQYSVSEWVIP